MEGVAWALVAALGFAFNQIFNRKANQVIDAYRTAFGVLLCVAGLLLARAVLAGELGLLAEAPLVAVAAFVGATLIHFDVGWTLMALSQQQIGVARTGALVSAAPVVATFNAAAFLGEPLTVATLAGVALAATGLALISLSGSSRNGSRLRSTPPWFALGTAAVWGTSPLLIRTGLEHFDHPVLGLTIGLTVGTVVYALALTVSGTMRRRPLFPAAAAGWLAGAGTVAAVAIAAQWTSYDLTTIAVSITVQQLATLLVVALVPLFFQAPLERLNRVFLAGTAAMLAGTAIVVWSGA